jgi:hypothetical protein
MICFLLILKFSFDNREVLNSMSNLVVYNFKINCFFMISSHIYFYCDPLFLSEQFNTINSIYNMIKYLKR